MDVGTGPGLSWESATLLDGDEALPGSARPGELGRAASGRRAGQWSWPQGTPRVYLGLRGALPVGFVRHSEGSVAFSWMESHEPCSQAHLTLGKFSLDSEVVAQAARQWRPPC